jgi:hypothetical protein
MYRRWKRKQKIMKNKLKLTLAAVALAMCGLAAQAQTNNTAGPVQPSLMGGVEQILSSVGLVSDPTNYAGAVVMGRSLKGNQLSAGFIVAENINNNVGVIAGIDHLWFGGKTGSANIVAGGLTLKVATHPLALLSSSTNSFLAKLTATPFAIAMIGTPMNGTGNADGGLAAVNRAGAYVDLINFKGWEFSLLGDYGNRTGAGNYSGNWIDFGLAIRKGF